jgi:hypothetical protein
VDIIPRKDFMQDRILIHIFTDEIGTGDVAIVTIGNVSGKSATEQEQRDKYPWPDLVP